MTHPTTPELPDELKDVDYLWYESDPVIEELVNDFIKKATPNSFAHYVDDDENDGQLLRTQLTKYLEIRLAQKDAACERRVEEAVKAERKRIVDRAKTHYYPDALKYLIDEIEESLTPLKEGT